MEKKELLTGREVSVYFDDGFQITRKDGIVVEISDNSIVFKTDFGKIQIIPFPRIIRIVEKSQNGGG